MQAQPFHSHAPILPQYDSGQKRRPKHGREGEMRTHNAIITAAAYCAATVSGFQSSVGLIRPSVHSSRYISSSLAESRGDGDGQMEETIGPLGGSTSDVPRSLGRGTFLGVRRESGVMRRMLDQQRRQEEANKNSRVPTALSSSATALMPDGGLSPCVIKVLGVGGGGSNAVSCSCILFGVFGERIGAGPSNC